MSTHPDRGGACAALRSLRSARAIRPSATSPLLFQALLYDYGSKYS
jgi:hypothetical protein